MVSLLKDGHSKKTPICEPCSIRQKQETASHWCKTCIEYFCDDCINVHKSTKMSTNHLVMSVQEVTEDDIMLSNLSGLFCCKHDNETASFYCVEDKQAFCAVCTTPAHTNKHEVLHTDDIAKKLCDEINEKDLKSLHEMEYIVQRAFTGDESSESKYENDVEDIIENIDEVIRKCTSHIHMLGKKLKHLINERKEIEKDKYEKRRKHITQFRTCLHSQIKIAELCSKMSDSQAISFKFSMKDTLSTEYETVQQAFDGATDKHLKFDSNVLFNQLQAFTSMGDIKVETTPSVAATEVASINQYINGLPQGLLPGPQTQVAVDSTKQWSEVTATLKKVISKQGMNIGDVLYDSAYLSDGQLVVTDPRRCKLLLFDASVTLQAQYDVLSGPSGVCVSADGALIYVVHYNGTLVTYRLQEGLQQVSHITLQGSTTGVGVSGDTIITGYGDNITLYDKKGEKLSSMSKKGSHTIICLSQDGTKFYHKDDNHIVCHNVSDLAEVFRYSHPELRGPWGIASYRHGNILVAGHKSGNIIMIHQDGTQGRVLLDKLHSIKRPTVVCCHPQRDEFVVISFGEYTVMEVYEMK